MAIYISKGKISYIGEEKTGTSQSGFTWRNIEVTLEIPGFQGSVTKQVFRASGDKVDEVLRFKAGDNVEIGFTLYAREWNNRLFNNVDLVSIKGEGAGSSEATAQAPSPTPKAQEINKRGLVDDPDADLPF